MPLTLEGLEFYKVFFFFFHGDFEFTFKGYWSCNHSQMVKAMDCSPL